MKIYDYSPWIEHLKDPLVLVAFTTMLFVSLTLTFLKRGNLRFSTKQAERLIMLIFKLTFIISIIVIVVSFVFAFKKMGKEENISKSTLAQQNNAIQSPFIMGDATINYDSIPKATNEEKKVLETFERIKKGTITGIDFQAYVELLYDSDAEIKKYSKNPRANDYFVTSLQNTYNCYRSALSVWDRGRPETLIQNGIVSLYQEAEREFNSKTAPILLKKWQECSYYLEESTKIAEKSGN